jgi:hypothetical protein
MRVPALFRTVFRQDPPTRVSTTKSRRFEGLETILVGWFLARVGLLCKPFFPFKPATT